MAVSELVMRYCPYLLVAFLMSQVALASDPADLPGGKDSPLLSRYAGSSLVAFANISYEQATFPLTNEVDDKTFVKAKMVEGKITRLAYLAPAGKTVLEVARNYQQALAKAGLVVQFACEKEKCGPHRIQEPFMSYPDTMTELQSYGGYSGVGHLVMNTSDSPFYFWGSLTMDGQPVYVSVFTSRLEASQDSPLDNRAGTFIEIVEPKPMETDKVSVDATALGAAVRSAGKVALYGIYFDTGKADIKPESKDQLTEIGKFLNSDKTLKLFVVGHTDNVGSLEANQLLSQQRANAVAAALVKDYHVAPGRVTSKGVGNLCPVASNTAEAGRAKNRRVELVQQ